MGEFPTNRSRGVLALLVLLLGGLGEACGGSSGQEKDVLGDSGTEGDLGTEGADSIDDGRDWDSGTAQGISRLRAVGTRIVDEDGAEVRLRGVNLGAWMFHETWISQVGFTTSGRALQLAQKKGLVEQVKLAAAATSYRYGEDPAVVTVCPGDGPEWLAAFALELEKVLGAEQAQSFLAELGEMPVQCDDSDRKLRLTLATRFGPDKRDELLDAFRRAWVTEADIAWLAQQGFNVVRVPIGYRSLMTGEDSDAPDSLVWNETALTRLDELFAWCEKHGVWAVLDIQEAPGGQNTYGAEAGLYNNPKMQDLTIEMWEVLSDRYKNINAVAAYSLLAEPYGATDEATRDAMYDRLVKAVRARGDDHLCIIHDGFMGMEGLPDPATFGWTNVVYSTHLFEWNASSLQGYEFAIKIYEASFSAAQKKQNVPYYIGSFSTIQNSDWAYEASKALVTLFEGKGWSWSLWTYKRVENRAAQELFGFGTSWGLRSVLDGEFAPPDPDLDSFEGLLEALKRYDQVVLEPIPPLLEALTTF